MPKTCDLCNQPVNTRTRITDKRFEKPLTHAQAEVCPTCFRLWSVGDDEALIQRIKKFKLMGLKEEKD